MDTHQAASGLVTQSTALTGEQADQEIEWPPDWPRLHGNGRHERSCLDRFPVAVKMSQFGGRIDAIGDDLNTVGARRQTTPHRQLVIVPDDRADGPAACRRGAERRMTLVLLGDNSAGILN